MSTKKKTQQTVTKNGTKTKKKKEKKTASKNAKSTVNKRSTTRKVKKPESLKKSSTKTKTRKSTDSKKKAKSTKQSAKSQSQAKARQSESTKGRKVSLLDAAVSVLKGIKQPMRCMEIYKVITEKQLWKSKGKTPCATLYSAIIREIDLKGEQSRFKKAERGMFTLKKVNRKGGGNNGS